MSIDDNIRDEKLQYDFNREAAKKPLPPGKIDKYQCLTGKEILPFNQSQMIDQPFERSFWKTNNNWRSRKKQAEALQSLNPEHQLKSVEDIFPKNLLNKEAY